LTEDELQTRRKGDKKKVEIARRGDDDTLVDFRASGGAMLDQTYSTSLLPTAGQDGDQIRMKQDIYDSSKAY
jgi:hypothetical protein